MSVNGMVTLSADATCAATTRILLGVPISVFDRACAVNYFDEALRQKRVLKIAFANAHTLNIAAANIKIRAELQKFCVLNDGLGLDIGSRIKFGMPFPENMNGTDFTPYYLAQTRHALRIYLLGATPAVVEAAAKHFEQAFPRHSFVGFHHGYLEGEVENSLSTKIASAKADVVLVAMGNPLQELWIAKNAAATGAILHIGVGALFDFVVGRTTRAPHWVRKVRCEWLYRLYLEPQRLWRRYLIGNVVFLKSALLDRYSLGRGAHGAFTGPEY